MGSMKKRVWHVEVLLPDRQIFQGSSYLEVLQKMQHTSDKQSILDMDTETYIKWLIREIEATRDYLARLGKNVPTGRLSYDRRAEEEEMVATFFRSMLDADHFVSMKVDDVDIVKIQPKFVELKV